MNDKVKYHLWDISARLGAVIPPLGATLYFFPEWIKKSSGATFSGMLLVALLVLMIPLWRKVFDALKSVKLTDASMPLFWVIFCGVFFALQTIVDRMIYIGIAGLIGSFISIGFCMIRNRYRESLQQKKAQLEIGKDEA